MDKQFWLRTFLFLHVLGAVTSLGPSLTYGLWIGRAERRDPAARAFALGTISWIDRRLATPSYVAQLVTGVVLIWLTGIDLLHTAWLELGIALYVVMTVFAVGFFAPAFRRQRQLAERIAAAEGTSIEDYDALAARSRSFGTTAVLLTLAILLLMVTKPALWSAG